MRRHVLLLSLAASFGATDLPGQTAVDAPRPEKRDRERKVVEREQERRAQQTNVEIRGATAFKEDELRSILKEQIATIHDFGLTPARADDAAFFLELFYRKHGYARVNVHYSIENGSRLVLEVTEGPQAELATINFVGNAHIPAEQLFEYAVGPTRERYSRLQKTLPFVASDVQEGADLIHRYYVNDGFLDASVDPPQYRFSENGARVNVIIVIHEGRQYFFGEIRFEGNTVYSPEALRGQMLDLLSQPYTDRRVDDISRRLQAYYKARGYYAVKVETAGESAQSRNGHVPVTVAISPGAIYKFDGVSIKGLQRLRPSYVRNRFASLNGKTYSPDVLDEKFRELMRTGLFQVLQINPEPVGGNYLRLDIAAEEAKAKEFGISVGYGSYTGFIVGAQFADRDLFGYGRPLVLSAEWSERGYKGEIFWDDPHLLESDFEFKIRIAALTFDYDGYSKFEVGGRIEILRKITKQYEVGVFASDHHDDITSTGIKRDLLGPTTYFVSAMGFFHTLDLRDSPVVPSRGFVFNQTFDVAANAIGSDIEFFRTTAKASYFIPIGRTLLEFGARGGLVRPLHGNPGDITSLPIDERFFIGGATTVRSFGERDLGPHDRGGDPIGGEFYTIFNVEYTFPIFGELQAAVFADAGNLLPDADNPGFNDMRYALGAGLRYKLPIGPIRLDYGVNPDPRPHEDFGAFHFSFGLAF
ncbi:MAG: outer membrane protein insertion porin family [Verrucomicrobiota bacterium]|jgi:outer membrane protein assembly complex protein YaeT